MQKLEPKLLRPVVWIGKNGITEGVINQIRSLLKHRKMIKVKFLRSFLESNERTAAAKEIASFTDSVVVEQTGFTVVLRRK